MQCAQAARDPSDSEIAAALDASARAHRIPTVLLKGLAWRMSGWRQWDAAGKTNEQMSGRVGLLGVAAADRSDADRLRSDWRYNVEQGTKALALAWDRAPIIGNGRLEDGRNILECWYFALGRYGVGKQGAEANAFADSVLDAVATGSEGRWPGIAVTRPSAEKLSWGRNVLGPPVPWHFGDVQPRSAAKSVVSLPIPYLSQVWDSPDNFNGGGACGPTSMLMVLAYYQKVAPHPIRVTDSYVHVSEYGGLLPEIEGKVCDPNLGAVHAKMLDYLRPHFPTVAIFYDAKATWQRVKHELDAGRPCILGTEVTPAGHLMVARGYLSDGRVLVNDPAGDYYQAARWGNPQGGWSPTGSRYWNGGGSGAAYDWDSLDVRWVMTFGPKDTNADRAEDENLR
jgi:hypothetical protein